ncbi:MAG: hypothetical protein KA764_07820 [Anaerolineales bacterium]|nr:hypothetical protein [Anaerolineales bacterium]
MTPAAPWRLLDAGGLPIFRSAGLRAGAVWFYAPGYLALAAPAQAEAFAAGLSAGANPGGWASPVAGELVHHAAEARRRWAEAEARPFAPVCLTLYLNNACNLNCVYCYSSPRRPGRLTLDAVWPAARMVAANCRAQGRPLVVVMHGGGEPALDQRLADALLTGLDDIARLAGVTVFRYIATNGALSAARARWLAERFDLIGLSCDGPEDVQTRQRPMAGGGASTPLVERTARLVRAAGKPLHVRVTVTADSLSRQAETAAYVCAQLKPQEVHVEPVYGAGGGADLSVSQAPEFVAEFVKARAVARGYGVRWLTSGSRLEDIHGAYCQVFREVLHVVPGGAATACFQTVDTAQARERALVIGAAAADGFSLDIARVETLRRQLRREPARCAGCFNRYHCARGCPDHCPLSGIPEEPGFRCQAGQGLTEARLQAAAKQLPAPAGSSGIVGAEVSELEDTGRAVDGEAYGSAGD